MKLEEKQLVDRKDLVCQPGLKFYCKSNGTVLNCLVIWRGYQLMEMARQEVQTGQRREEVMCKVLQLEELRLNGKLDLKGMGRAEMR